MATLSLVAIATGPTTASFGGQFNGGDSNYSYQRLVRVTMSDYGTFDVYSAETSGGYNTFSQTLTGLSPGTTYTWSAVLYYSTTGGWVATSYTDSGSFTTETQTYTYYGYLVFDANGGTGGPSSSAVASVTTTDSWGYVICDIPTSQPTRSGYTFAGWATDAAGTGTIRYPGGTCTIASSNKTSPGTVYTLYAVWQKSTYYVTVVYNANGGSGAPSSQTVTGTMRYLSVTLSSVEPTRSGYIFLGWATSASATAADYSAGQTLNSVYAGTTSDYTWNLYAVWGQNSTGKIYVYYNGAWKLATPYVYYNGTWKLATPYVYYNGTWKIPAF